MTEQALRNPDTRRLSVQSLCLRTQNGALEGTGGAGGTSCLAIFSKTAMLPGPELQPVLLVVRREYGKIIL